jgi:hypothetical protein
MEQFDDIFSDEKIDRFDNWIKAKFAPVFLGFAAGYFLACIVRALP